MELHVEPGYGKLRVTSLIATYLRQLKLRRKFRRFSGKLQLVSQMDLLERYKLNRASTYSGFYKGNTIVCGRSRQINIKKFRLTEFSLV
jgi:hypothetical protein